ncbi:hypothetical protein HMPREF3201_01446 [Megasphaera sp. MJR8396C]|nr:hypothetical protein HMPREF3201_01446 [Megasphaera sp. MJR8396C]
MSLEKSKWHIEIFCYFRSYLIIYPFGLKNKIRLGNRKPFLITQKT